MKKNGFTLIELLVVMTILAVLFGLAMVSYQGAKKSARDGKRKADLEEVRSALEMCRTDTDSYPPTGGFSFGGSLTCDDGTSYMDYVPVDPINSGSYRYTYQSLGGDSYQLCASLLETTGLPYCVTNP